VDAVIVDVGVGDLPVDLSRSSRHIQWLTQPEDAVDLDVDVVPTVDAVIVDVGVGDLAAAGARMRRRSGFR